MEKSNFNLGEDFNFMFNQVVDQREDLVGLMNNLGFLLAAAVNGNEEGLRERCQQMLAEGYATLDVFIGLLDDCVKERDNANSGQ